MTPRWPNGSGGVRRGPPALRARGRRRRRDADGTTFRLTPSNDLQAQKIAEFLADHRGYKKVAILHDSSDFGREGAADLEGELSFGGAEVVLNAEFKPGGDVHT